MPGFGMAGLGGFAQGFGNSFSNSMHQSQELQLERQRLQMQQQREIMARADKVRSEMWDRLGETIAAKRANNEDKAKIMNDIKPFVSILERFTRSSGQDPSLVGMQLGLMLDKPNAYDIAFGKQKQKLDEFKQAQTAGVFNQSDAFEAGGAAPTPFARQDPNTGEGFMSPQGQMPQAPPVPQAMEDTTDASSDDVNEEMQRVGRALTVAAQQGDKGAEKVLTFRLQQLARQNTGKDVHIYQKKDGTGLYIYNPETRKATFQPFPDVATDKTYSQQAENYEPLYGLPAITPGQSQIIKNAEVTPQEFDFEAVQVAFGNKQLLTGRRDKEGQKYSRLLAARATDYWRAQGLGPQDANAAIAEFDAMRHGVKKIADIDAAMTQALGKAKATADVVKEQSKKIPRSEYPAINSAILAWKENTGDKRLPPFLISLETLAMNYAAALGMGSSVITDSKADHARDLIKKAWSDGQLDAAVDQLLLEMNREQRSAHQAVHSYLAASPTTNSRFQQTQDPRDLTDDDLDKAIEEAKRRAGSR